jgi:Domain of unknown function (DUF6980)
MPEPDERDECKCGHLGRLAEDPREAVEFDAQLNEYHVRRTDGSGYSLIYFCPLCGGRAPKSQRGSLFHRLTDAERHRLTELTKDLRTVQEVIAALGEPDLKGLRVSVTTPEKEGKPETTQTYPAMTYSKLSDSAIINVQVYPNDRVAITFQGKPMLVQQTHEFHMAPSAKPQEPEAPVDTGKRYDVYCIEPNRQSVVYRNARFKGAVALLPHPGGRMHYADYIELEQANGQSIFIPRSSIFRFCEPGTAAIAEAVSPDK